jgi:hypothetical protein
MLRVADCRAGRDGTLREREFYIFVRNRASACAAQKDT